MVDPDEHHEAVIYNTCFPATAIIPVVDDHPRKVFPAEIDREWPIKSSASAS